MATDPKLLKEFRAGIKQIYLRLSPNEFLEVVKDKLIDFVSRNPKVGAIELKEAIKEIFNPEMAKWMRDVNKTYNNVIDLVNELYPHLAGDLRRDLVKLQRIEKANNFKLGDFADDTITHIKNSLVKSYLDKLTYKETIELIGKEDERARFYAKTIATTGMRAYARAGKNEKANLAEVFYYEYVGPLRVRSRPFCRKMIGQTMHITQINKLNEAEIGKAYISPCIRYCGGWNCGHDWEPDPSHLDK